MVGRNTNVDSTQHGIEAKKLEEKNKMGHLITNRYSSQFVWQCVINSVGHEHALLEWTALVRA